MAVACYNRTSPIECSELGWKKLPLQPISDAVIPLVRLTRGRDEIYLAEINVHHRLNLLTRR